MNYKYSLAHLTCLPLDPPTMVHVAAKAGYDYVGIRPIYMGLPGEPNYALANKPEMLKATKQAIKDTGVGVYDIELARIRDEQDVSDYEPGIAAGAELGAQTLICSIWTPNKEYYTEQFAKLCGIADQYNINVMLEFVTFASVNTLAMAKEVIEATKPKNASLMIDTLHFSRSRVDINELNDLPCPVKMAHICDGPATIPAMDDKDALIHTARAERLYIGEGAIDMKSIINKLPNDIVLSVELPHLERVIEYGQFEHARRCLESAKNYFK